MKNILYCLLLSLISAGSLKSQTERIDSVKPVGTSFVSRLHYGFILNHHPEMAYFTDRHIAPFEFSINKQTKGVKPWHYYYNYPTSGVTFFSTSFAGSEILGNVIAVYPYLSLPLADIGNKMKLNLDIGAGPAYFTKKFHRYENVKNLAVGSGLNAIISIKSDAEIRISEFVNLNIGAGLTHFSNGAVKTPNLGINIFTVNTGVSYYPWGRIHAKDTIKSDDNKQMYYSLWLAGAIKETYPVYGPKFFAGTISCDALYTLGHKSRAGVGLDLFWDETDIKYFNDHEMYYSGKLSALKTGLSLVHELRLSKLSFLQYMGLYIHAKNKTGGPFYHRLALRYFVYNGFYANLSLKTHWGKADYTEWGIGYRFKN